LISNVKRFRYERKFNIEGRTAEEVEAMIRFHPATFSEIFHERVVNNIYFDSFNMRHYFDNVNGANMRLKMRIRWYGDLFGTVEEPVLELKLKHNLHVGKLLYPLKEFVMDAGFSINDIRRVFAESSISEAIRPHLSELNFSLLNSYTRKYFLSSDRNYRVTVDRDVMAYGLSPHENRFLRRVVNRTGVILELKYNKAQDESADCITNYFPFRMTRSSKYVNGLERLYA